jgi:aspartate racemase
MKRIGIIGGLSPESTVTYYTWLNQGIQQRLGGHHSAKILLSSVDFGEFVALKEAGDWDTQGDLLTAEALSLERAGADCILLATNTMHRLAEQIEAALTIPFLHLADATADAICAHKLSTIGLLGTRYTMELDFYKNRLARKGITTLVPDDAGRHDVHTIIYDELCHGTISEESRTRYRDIIQQLADRGAQGVILGCTEITLLVEQSDARVPLFDTTRIHVDAALNWATSSL